MDLPVARKEIVRDTHFGTAIEDSYRWMEDWKGKELRSWVQAQGAYTREYLDALPARSALLKRINELGDTVSLIYNIQVEGGSFFYLRRDPGEKVGKLVVRAGVDEPERVLFDPNKLEGDVHTAIDWYAPSRNGQYVAYGSSQGGSEESTLRVLEVKTARILDLAISRVRFGGVSWLEDSRSFVYHRFPELPADAPETEKYNNSRTHLHHLEDDPDSDAAIFGRGINPGVEMAPEDVPMLTITPRSEWVMGMVIHGVLNEITLYAAPKTTFTDPAHCTWTKIADVEDAVTGFELHENTIYLLTHKDAPRYKVIATSLTNPDLANATPVVPGGSAVIEEIRVAGDYLLTRDLDGGIGHIRRVSLSGGEPEQVSLPFDGTITQWASETGSPEVVVQMTAWTISPRIYLYNAIENTLRDTGWSPPSPVDFSDIEAHEVFAAAKDGTQIPLSIIHKKGLQLDGNNPTLLTGYGSYGITINPTFLPIRLAWFERGGVIALAHIRGGGEYGETWHKAGQKLNKQNTIDDFIACAEYLIERKYTRPERLAGEGTSAGGVPSGGSLVKRPDLWAAMVIRVAVTNFLRFEFTENGPSNIPEFGSITTEDGFKGLQIMDSYTKVKDGVKYPAVLLTTGLNDPRVVVWQATKMAARLQAATVSGKPVLLRVEEQAGHGMGSTRQQVEEEAADEWAFLLQQMGI